jgi:hypothetical protein
MNCHKYTAVFLCYSYAFSKPFVQNSLNFLSHCREYIFIWALKTSLTFCCYGRSALGAGLSLRFKGSLGCDYRSCPCSEHTLQSIAFKNALFFVLGTVAKFRRPTISIVMSGRLFTPLSVRMEKLAFH